MKTKKLGLAIVGLLGLAALFWYLNHQKSQLGGPMSQPSSEPTPTTASTKPAASAEAPPDWKELKRDPEKSTIRVQPNPGDIFLLIEKSEGQEPFKILRRFSTQSSEPFDIQIPVPSSPGQVCLLASQSEGELNEKYESIATLWPVLLNCIKFAGPEEETSVEEVDSTKRETPP